MKTEVFNHPDYLNFDKVRFDNFDKFKIELKDKNILELGAGIGNHTQFLIDKKPNLIVAVDGREDNIDALNSSFSRVRCVTAMVHDLEKPLKLEEDFDLIYNYGVLYHLKNPFEFIENLQVIKHKQMVIETCISLDGDENNINEDSKSNEMALSGVGSRPNLYKLTEALMKHYKTVIYPAQPIHKWYDIHNVVNPPALKRIVIICSK